MSISRPALIVTRWLTFLKKNYPVREFSSSSKKMNQKLEKLIRELPPPLTNNKYKGQAGRVGVFGGSLEYTGAPYFAAIASLKVGADLSHVFCAKEAAGVIKSYSPELIVHPLLDAPDAAAQIEPWLDRLHVILIGPGLGREKETFKVVTEVISLCRKRRKPLVIDADGLFYLTLHNQVLLDYPAPVILTPNAMEFSRLMGIPVEEPPSPVLARPFLTLSPNINILCKGHQDYIFSGKAEAKVESGGSGRRCGGQGDLLSGATSTMLAWALGRDSGDVAPMVAAVAACRLIRRCNEKAFARLGRSMTCSDMIGEIHEAFEELFGKQ